MGVLTTLHGRGCGRRLVEEAERWLRARSVEFLQVKTLGPSRPNSHYERTRGFYNRLGFRPLEENDLWGANPCLVLVKHLACTETDDPAQQSTRASGSDGAPRPPTGRVGK